MPAAVELPLNCCWFSCWPLMLHAGDVSVQSVLELLRDEFGFSKMVLAVCTTTVYFVLTL